MDIRDGMARMKASVTESHQRSDGEVPGFHESTNQPHNFEGHLSFFIFVEHQANASIDTLR